MDVIAVVLLLLKLNMSAGGVAETIVAGLLSGIPRAGIDSAMLLVLTTLSSAVG